MIEIIRTNTNDKRFKGLISELDNDLSSRYKDGEYQFDINIQLNAIDTAVIAKINNITVGCGCFKELDTYSVEIKRMYVNPYFRGFGIASVMIDALTGWAKELLYKKAALEIGKKQPEAIKLYKKHGFEEIPCFEPYTENPESIFLGKLLS